MRRIITTIVEDKPGVLNRVTNLMARRGFNIASITVGQTHEEGLSRMTFVLDVADEKSAEQVVKQLNKQIHVLRVNDITGEDVVSRELALIKISVTNQNRPEIQAIVDPFRARILDVSKSSTTIEVTGSTAKVDALIDILSSYGILEISRTGLTAFPRGK